MGQIRRWAFRTARIFWMKATLHSARKHLGEGSGEMTSSLKVLLASQDPAKQGGCSAKTPPPVVFFFWFLCVCFFYCVCFTLSRPLANFDLWAHLPPFFPAGPLAPARFRRLENSRWTVRFLHWPLWLALPWPSWGCPPCARRKILCELARA